MIETESIENLILTVWSDVLGVPIIDSDENFFDLGGDSLLLMKVHSRLEKRLGIKIEIVDLFEFTTVRMLSDRLRTLTPPRAE